jgi:hypothetical protein
MPVAAVKSARRVISTPRSVNGHDNFPIGGQEFSPLVDVISPRWRTSDLPVRLPVPRRHASVESSRERARAGETPKESQSRRQKVLESARLVSYETLRAADPTTPSLSSIQVGKYCRSSPLLCAGLSEPERLAIGDADVCLVQEPVDGGGGEGFRHQFLKACRVQV